MLFARIMLLTCRQFYYESSATGTGQFRVIIEKLLNFLTIGIYFSTKISIFRLIFIPHRILDRVHQLHRTQGLARKYQDLNFILYNCVRTAVYLSKTTRALTQMFGREGVLNDFGRTIRSQRPG
jgi:hypothetical protein